MEFDKIKELIEKQEIQAITIDTSIFDAEGLKLESGLLKQLEQFSDTSTKVIISEVVKNELFNHLEDKAKSAYTDIEKGLKTAKLYCQLEDDIDEIKQLIFKGRTPRDIAYNRLNDFIEITSLEIIKVQGYVKVSDLLNKYFQNEPPFAVAGQKKNEFPDAMALISLESWAKKNKTKVLVISQDNDWKLYCKHSENLVLIDNLSKCFELFQQVKPYDICKKLSEKYYQEDIDFIKNAITDKLENKIYDLNIYIEANSSYQYEDEITNISHEKNEFKIIKKPNIIFRPINFDKDTLVVEAELSVDVSIECNFYFTTWDSIDQEDVGIGANTINKEQSLDITVLVT
ncbi:PIN domain-containing protein, partial [Nostoc sp.]|uniref:PIN domain-containing protein n=1 Tax=Nostoc sp. TaxID=1180 RepID=UPI002FF6CBBE